MAADPKPERTESETSVARGVTNTMLKECWIRAVRGKGMRVFENALPFYNALSKDGFHVDPMSPVERKMRSRTGAPPDGSFHATAVGKVLTAFGPVPPLELRNIQSSARLVLGHQISKLEASNRRRGGNS